MGIIVDHVYKSFEGKPVLQDISFEVKDGEFVSFLAPTGEGKTTLLRIMAGVEKPDSGRVLFNGTDVTEWSVQQRHIAMVYQWFINYPSMTVYENIASPLRASKKYSKSEIDQKVHETAKLLKIDELQEHYPSEISGGQQQRLAIARALVKNADFIFLDEPLTNLDYKLQEELRVELKSIFGGKGHGAVIYATPQPIEALALSTSVGFLHQSRLLQYGQVEEVYYNPRHVEVGSYFSHPGMNIFECQLVNEHEHLWLKATDQLKVAVDAFRDVLTAEQYLLGIRAHGLSFERHDELAQPITATVELNEVVGSETEIHLNHQGIPLVMLLQEIRRPTLGEEITAYFHPQRFFIYDKASGRLVAKTQQES